MHLSFCEGWGICANSSLHLGQSTGLSHLWNNLPGWARSQAEWRTYKDQTLTLLAQRDHQAWPVPAWVVPTWRSFCLFRRRRISRCQSICSLTLLSSYTSSRVCWHGKKNTFVWHTNRGRTFCIESRNLNYSWNTNALSGFSCQQPCCQWNLNVGKMTFKDCQIGWQMIKVYLVYWQCSDFGNFLLWKIKTKYCSMHGFRFPINNGFLSSN